MKPLHLLSAVIVFFIIAGGAAVFLFGSRNGVEPPVATDRVEQFLANHWTDPLPPQGEPPAGFSPVEASLAPEACGQCHVQQFGDWQNSMHSHAVGPGILWQFRLMDQASANRCLRCHAPLAEQKALMALENGWPGTPAAAPPPYVPGDLHRQGLVCAACHVRAHERYGPPPRQTTPGPLPHGGFRADSAFQDSRFCAVCHQFPESGFRLNGKLLENTYEEWRNSKWAREGESCQRCHMPERRHLWRGIHDPDMTARALSVALQLETLNGGRLRAEANITNAGAGHHFPTYVVPEVVLTLQLVNEKRRQDIEIARAVVARRANVDLTEELFDTRLTPGETRMLAGEFQRPMGMGWAIELRMAVHPGEHYERSFEHALAQVEMDAQARGLLREALEQVKSRRYRVTLARAVL